MTHHEGSHQGNRRVLVGVTVLVVSSPLAASTSTPPQVSQREIGTVILTCTTPQGPAQTPPECRVVIRTPIR